jgi:hypothetical protein
METKLKQYEKQTFLKLIGKWYFSRALQVGYKFESSL